MMPTHVLVMVTGGENGDGGRVGDRDRDRDRDRDWEESRIGNRIGDEDGEECDGDGASSIALHDISPSCSTVFFLSCVLCVHCGELCFSSPCLFLRAAVVRFPLCLLLRR